MTPFFCLPCLSLTVSLPPHLSLAGSRRGNNSHRPRPLLCPAHQIRPAANGDPFFCCIQKKCLTIVSDVSCAKPLELRRIKTCMHSLAHLLKFTLQVCYSTVLGTKHNTWAIQQSHSATLLCVPFLSALWTYCYFVNMFYPITPGLINRNLWCKSISISQPSPRLTVLAGHPRLTARSENALEAGTSCMCKW